MPGLAHDRPIRRLRRDLIDLQVGVAPPAMLDAAAHMLLYYDDPAAMQRIALQHLLERYGAARADLGFCSPSNPIYKACASQRQRGCDIPDMIGREMPNLDRGIQVVWHSNRTVTFNVKTDPLLNRLRPAILALGTRSKLARRLEYRNFLFGIVCIDSTDDTCAWTNDDQRYLDEFVLTFMSPILAENLRDSEGEEPVHLTDAERAVTQLAVDGLSYKEIAAALGKSPNTVDNQLRQIRAKLAVRNQVELVHAFLALSEARTLGRA